ncbi:MAG: peptide chain release factor 1 [Candidatus Omnitrophica bacterium]|nr:peptide chain release factor 1 [Candidatus Omnitrophota bacterium]
MPISRQELLEQLAQLERRYTALEAQAAAHAERQGESQAYQRVAKELSDLREIVMTYRTYRSVERDAVEAEAIFHAQGDFEIRELAKEEAASLRRQQAQLFAQLERCWAQRHEHPERPLIVEIRAGTGGLEASLFVADLYRMFTKYAAKCGLSVEPMHGQPTEAGGLKEVAFSVNGPGAWQRFKYERGVHRVQRVPSTEAQGRIHTSTVTVAVLPEPEEVELPPIPVRDLQLDVYRSSGPGGQGVNTTDSAVRIRHIPTGLVVTCQDERSQLRNKEKAMRVLRARLLDQMQREKAREVATDRRRQVGTGERSEKIRTYNFPDRRVTDHRIGVTLHKLDLIMEGELQELVELLIADERAKGLEQP